jgi:REP element-mobilizing transposase RayT
LHYGRKQIQPASKDIGAFYKEAGALLKHSLLSFTPAEFTGVADAISHAIGKCNYTCYAFAVMPDHVHLLIRRHRDRAEEMIEKIQSLSRERLWEIGLRDCHHPTWTCGGWKVFLDHPDDINRTIQYIENNPVKMRLPAQRWAFVNVYDNWPLHAGHSMNSPYVRALRAAGRYPR